jgi:hypothetical protein
MGVSGDPIRFDQLVEVPRCAALRNSVHSAAASAVIGKVLRGQRPRGLLYYLFGPGRREEHTDPHISPDGGTRPNWSRRCVLMAAGTSGS